MLAWPEIITQLAAHAESLALREAAMRGCDQCFANEGGTIDGWSSAELRKKFHSHKLAFAHARLDPYIETTILLFAPDGSEIGSYRSINDLEGVEEDDYLVLRSTKAAHTVDPPRRPGSP